MSEVIIAIDEGTTGTRAGRVFADGTVTGLEYRRLTVTSPRPGVVEQDPEEILTATLDAIAHTVAAASAAGEKIVAFAISTQRSTAVLWDLVTGRALGPAMVWQDTRYAEQIAEYAAAWDGSLIPAVGRPTGVRSPYYWAKDQLDQVPEIREAYEANRLAFGTVDTWLLWHLAKEKPLVTSATNATACGALRLREAQYHTEYISALGFPVELLPEVVDDGEVLGHTRPELVGCSVPIRALIGDQHAAILGLGCVTPGSCMVVHGTGSFVDLVVGKEFPQNPGLYDATLTLTGWRTNRESIFSVETFTATTGSALDWFCDRLGWFSNAIEVSAEAAKATDSGGVVFIPALTGLRVPRMLPEVRASLTGITTATTKPQVARALLEGIAHFVVSSIEANSAVAERRPKEIVVGGGMAASDVLLQAQADLAGVPMRRSPASDVASLRGAAFLAGVGLLWPDLPTAVATLPSGQIFEPRIDDPQRRSQRMAWRRRIQHEMDFFNERTY